MGKETTNDTNVYITLLKVNISSNQHLEEKSTPGLEISVGLSKQLEEDIYTSRLLMEAFTKLYVHLCIGRKAKVIYMLLKNINLVRYMLSIDEMYKVKQDLEEYRVGAVCGAGERWSVPIPKEELV